MQGTIARAEIFQQPELWPTTLARVKDQPAPWPLGTLSPLVTGAGSSAYAATAIALAWPGARAVPTTDLLVDARRDPPAGFGEDGLVVSIARSGDSPESVGVVELLRELRPHSRHVAITCNADGRLARAPGVHAILLDPRTNDRSLAVTSSFSNTVLAGLALRHFDRLAAALPSICERVNAELPSLDAAAAAIARTPFARVAVLAPPALFGGAREAALKILEMSDGQIMSMPETVLGIRHGPLTFLRDDALVVLIASTDPLQRRYEEDLLRELRAKALGRIVVVTPVPLAAGLADESVPASAPDLPDALRTPFEIVFPQLLALHLGLRMGVDPDEPSPRGVINRVVQGVRVHEA
jgi:D-galactosamine 6-phosphate deaminase/isomerase